MIRTTRFLLFAITLGCSVCQAIPAVTASHRAPSPEDAQIAVIVERVGSPEMSFDRRWAQTFLAETSGDLLSVSVTAQTRSQRTEGLEIAVAELDGGQPGRVLANAPVADVILGRIEDPLVLQAEADFSGLAAPL